jgi:hypothetical protein
MPAPKLLENLVRLLLPPACREHVLGDLQERYKSPKSYLSDALSVLGPVIISRIRRTTDFQVFAMEALALYLSFTATAWYVGQQSFLYDHAGFARLTVPTSVAVMALLLCNAYSDPERKSFSKPILQSAGCVSLAFLGQTLLFDTQSVFTVPFPIMLYGGILGMSLVSALRMLFPPVQNRLKMISTNRQQFFQDRKFIHAGFRQHFLQRVSQVQSNVKPILACAVLAVFLASALLLAHIRYAGFSKPHFFILTAVVLVTLYRIIIGG